MKYLPWHNNISDAISSSWLPSQNTHLSWFTWHSYDMNVLLFRNLSWQFNEKYLPSNVLLMLFFTFLCTMFLVRVYFQIYCFKACFYLNSHSNKFLAKSQFYPEDVSFVWTYLPTAVFSIGRGKKTKQNTNNDYSAENWL